MDDPIAAVAAWFDEATRAGLRHPNAMALATVGADGRPSARMVLLKSFDEHGFVFFTNRESRKGDELGANPYAALVLYWEPLNRQVRVEGAVERLDDAESAAYYATRPRGSQLAAWVSPQSRPIESRDVLVARVAELAERYEGQEIPLPPFWGGYRVVPDAVELWQSRPDRLHDRIRYERSADGWVGTRLGP